MWRKIKEVFKEVFKADHPMVYEYKGKYALEKPVCDDCGGELSIEREYFRTHPGTSCWVRVCGSCQKCSDKRLTWSQLQQVLGNRE